MEEICELCELRRLKTGICAAKKAKRIIYARINKDKQPPEELSTLFKAASHPCDCNSFIQRK